MPRICKQEALVQITGDAPRGYIPIVTSGTEIVEFRPTTRLRQVIAALERRRIRSSCCFGGPGDRRWQQFDIT